MSHACLIVAISPEEIEQHGSIENAVAWNMEPFCENEVMFQDGSRWDWYTIGGRWAGKFEPDYVPEKDPYNIEVCNLCSGTGKRTDMVVQDGCNGCQGSGKKVKYPSKWVDRGNITLRKDVEDMGNSLSAYGFLQNRRWCERDRLGWFGCPATTECSKKSEANGEGPVSRCIHQHEESGSKIVSWGENEEGNKDQWSNLFWARFIRNLPSDTALVCVDYHV